MLIASKDTTKSYSKKKHFMVLVPVILHADIDAIRQYIFIYIWFNNKFINNIGRCRFFFFVLFLDFFIFYFIFFMRAIFQGFLSTSLKLYNFLSKFIVSHAYQELVSLLANILWLLFQ